MKFTQRLIPLFAFWVLALSYASSAKAQTAPNLDQIRQLTPDYRLAPRDLIQVQVYEDADTLVVQRITESGEVSVPMVGNVKLSGKTIREGERVIADAYIKGGFFVKPQVIISVQTYAPRSISIMGQVSKPDNIAFPVERDTLGLVQAITLAGGFTRVAKSDAVQVIRVVDGKEQTFTVNVAAYLESKSAVSQFMLQPEDIVFVPERAF